jgi:hypothetical protein
MEAIKKKNMLSINPIIVNGKMEIIDGQHRLEAAKALGLHIFYLKDADITKEDIATLNSNNKNWSTMDYINYWTIEKRDGFDKLSSFLSEHPLIPPSTALRMMSLGGGNRLSELKNGYVDVADYRQASEIADILKEYRNIVDFAYDRNFVLAVISCYRVIGYDHAVMRKRLEYLSRRVVKCVSVRDYIDMFEELYNYNSSKNTLKFK